MNRSVYVGIGVMSVVLSVSGVSFVDYAYEHPQVIEENVSRHELVLRCCGLSDLEGLMSVPGIEKIKHLDVSFNRLKSVPLSIGRLVNLETVSFNCNNLAELPEAIGLLENLEVLEVARNELTTLPNGIGSLKNIKRLDASKNKLSGIPRSVENLGKLEVLDLAKNHLKKMPEEIGGLEALKRVYLPDRGASRQAYDKIRRRVEQEQNRSCIMRKSHRSVVERELSEYEHGVPFSGMIIIIEP